MARLSSIGQGRLARLGIGAQVTVSGLLALAAVLMINWLAARPGLRQRFDLTATSQNTLSTATMGVLRRLPGEVTIDVFFREPEEQVLAQIAGMAMGRTSRLLGLYRDLSDERVRVRTNNMEDTSLIEERRRELRLRGIEPCLVLSYGDAREAVLVNGDLAIFEVGQPNPNLPNYSPPRIAEFRAERAITQALLKVTRGEELGVYFTTGHGELEIPDTRDFGLDSLHGMLMDEGLRIGRWNPNEDGELPEDCACLSILNPTDRLSKETLDQIAAYVEGGGRLIVAPPSEDDALKRSDLNSLLGRFQLEVQEGMVCQLMRDPTTGQVITGSRDVALFAVNPANMKRHPLVEPFRASGRTFWMNGAHPVRLTGQPDQGLTTSIFTSEVFSWVDSTPNDFRLDQAVEANSRKFDLAVASQFRLKGAGETSALQEESQARVVLVGSSFAFTNVVFDQNYDFLRNLYNWTLDREYRLSMSPRNPDLRLWPTERLDNLPAMGRLAWLYVPGLCFLLGFLFAYLRSRGGPRVTNSPS